MGPLPPMSFTGGAASGGTAGGASSWSQGDWNVNLAGSGVALQTSPTSLLLVALAVGAAWLLLRKR